MTQGVELASGPSSGPFGRFLGYAAGILALLWVIGYFPTLRLAGESGPIAMVAGSFLSLVGSVVGTMPFVWFRDRQQGDFVARAMGAIALRLSVVIVLALAVALSGFFANAPLLIWVAISHAGLLVADTFFARSQFSDQPGDPALAR